MSADHRQILAKTTDVQLRVSFTEHDKVPCFRSERAPCGRRNELGRGVVVRKGHKNRKRNEDFT